MEYGKIDTLFERDKQTFVVNPEEIKRPVLLSIRDWIVTEKIDGTNIRVCMDADGTMAYKGRTDNAQIHQQLFMHLANTFTREKMMSAFFKPETPEGDDTPLTEQVGDAIVKAGILPSVVLYGEGYGAGIQKGGGYRPDKSFILFDVLVDGKWWLKRADVENVAENLGIPIVQELGIMQIEEIVEMVRDGFDSPQALLDSGQKIPAEGIVAQPLEPLFFNDGKRVIIKLKTKDFIAGKR